jgi:hypothetical protein
MPRPVCSFRARRRFENAALLAIDENDIHVRTVIQLLAAQFAQAEHAKLRLAPLFLRVQMPRLAQPRAQTRGAQAIDRLQANVGHVGNLARDFGHVAQARQIAGGDAQHLPLLEQAQAAEGGLVVRLFEPRFDLAAQPFLRRGWDRKPGASKGASQSG